MKKYTIDPRIFISPPYIKCPKCKKNTFGILSIQKDHYLRRCKNCMYPHANEKSVFTSLPSLNKKIIYIDQMAISNMMKALNPKTKAYKKKVDNEFWLLLFNKLDYLSKLQLIICPDSEFHKKESILSPFYKSLKRIYQLLSHGVSFESREVIERYQIYQHLTNWLQSDYKKELELDINTIVKGDLNGWQDHLIISADLGFDEKLINEFRKNREKLCKSLNDIFKRWQTETYRNFYDWFNEEVEIYGTAILEAHLNYLKKISKYQGIFIEESISAFFNPPPATVLIGMIKRTLEKNCIKKSDLIKKTDEYLHSPYIKNIPIIKISAMLYAAIARKAATGQKKPPNQGMYNDIFIISGLLPYCNAMFIDNTCYNYLNEHPLVDEIDYDTKLFSQNCKEEFIKYLDNIESDATESHINKVYEVYGKNWIKPFNEIFKN